ncbi:AmmeMemoRadiSam system protein B, partial [Candidatus Micrarchaeota archaeon]|nr:AmmeMemoRadiSam system protein B [Candidatus Micrarchaeota archaeon]
MKRESILKGRFYPKTKEEILLQLKKFVSNVKKEKKTDFIVSPHAGTIYSGQTAAYSYSLMKKPETIVILSPNHIGYGE